MRSSTDTEVEQYEDTGDRTSVKDKEKRAKAREARRLDGLKQMMSTPNGRLWMFQFFIDCKMFSTDFNGNSRDYFNLGQRNVGMPIFATVQNQFTDEYIQMIRENKDV